MKQTRHQLLYLFVESQLGYGLVANLLAVLLEKKAAYKLKIKNRLHKNLINHNSSSSISKSLK